MYTASAASVIQSVNPSFFGQTFEPFGYANHPTNAYALGKNGTKVRALNDVIDENHESWLFIA